MASTMPTLPQTLVAAPGTFTQDVAAAADARSVRRRGSDSVAAVALCCAAACCTLPHGWWNALSFTPEEVAWIGDNQICLPKKESNSVPAILHAACVGLQTPFGSSGKYFAPAVRMFLCAPLPVKFLPRQSGRGVPPANILPPTVGMFFSVPPANVLPRQSGCCVCVCGPSCH